MRPDEHLRLLAAADAVGLVVGMRRPKTPARAAFRPGNARGRRAWLAQAEKSLRRVPYDEHMSERGLPSPSD